MKAPAPDRGRAALWAAAALPLALLGLASCVLAFIFPLELEIREGTSWLHVLTLKAGISLYDHRRVAYVNMSHGPLDPYLKYVVSECLPFLGAAQVTRWFVLLLPFGLCYALGRQRCGKWAAVAGGGALYLFLLGLMPFHFLIGRSDPAAAFFLGLMLAAVPRPAGSEPLILRPGRAILLGLLAMAVFLTNWRFGPSAAALGLGIGLEAALGRRGGAGVLARYLGFAALAGAALFLAVLVGGFHGNPFLYYEHFFGFFLSPNSWGLHGDGPFSLFPAELRPGRWLAHALLVLLAAGALVRPHPRLGGRGPVLAWLALLAGLWVVVCYSYYENKAGGGLYYFGMFYVAAALALPRLIDAGPFRPLAGQALLAALLLISVPWRVAWRQVTELWQTRPAAEAFLADTRRLTGGRPIASDDIYFFQTRYQGQAIDMGDAVMAVAHQNVYDLYFDRTVDRYVARLKADPPEFIMMAGLHYWFSVASGPLIELVKSPRYQVILEAPIHLWPNGDVHEFLYRRVDPPPPEAVAPRR